MSTFLDRIEQPDAAELAEVERRLDAGDSPRSIGEGLHLAPGELIATVAALGLGPSDSDGPPLVQRDAPRPGWRAALAEPALAELLPDAARPARLPLVAGLLLVHDFWEPSHNAAQEADDLGERDFSAYWHGIAHRREPDPANAGYWFRRVGRHSLFGPLGLVARKLVEAQNDPAPGAERLVRGGAWDPVAYIEFCRSVRKGSPAEGLARRLQRLEMAMLLDRTAEAAVGRV